MRYHLALNAVGATLGLATTVGFASVKWLGAMGALVFNEFRTNDQKSFGSRMFANCNSLQYYFLRSDENTLRA